MQKETLIINEQHIAEICSKIGINFIMDEIIKSLEVTLSRYNEEDFQIKKREGYFYKKPVYGLIEWMPIYIPDKKMVTKIVGYHPTNPSQQKMSTIQAVICSFNINNGKMETMCEGNLATALRTGAASAIASKYLAKPNSTILGLIGCGTQSVTQLHAISRIFPIEKVYIYDTDEDALNDFSKRVSPISNAEIYKSTTEEIEMKSDIICTATSIPVGCGPVMRGENTKNHAHINAVGADFAGKFELPLSLLEKSFVCSDFLAQAMEEGECQQLKPSQIGSCLDEIIKNPNQFSKFKFERTIFDSTGFALEDYVALEVIEKHARELNIGDHIILNQDSSIPKNPYHFLNLNKDIL